MNIEQQRVVKKWLSKFPRIPDNLFSRSKAGLTREETRAIIVSKEIVKIRA